MEIIFAPIAIAIFLAPPFMSAIMARSFGRSYWKWFFIGCCLPLIANIILAFLPEVKRIPANQSDKIKDTLPK